MGCRRSSIEKSGHKCMPIGRLNHRVTGAGWCSHNFPQVLHMHPHCYSSRGGITATQQSLQGPSLQHLKSPVYRTGSPDTICIVFECRPAEVWPQEDGGSPEKGESLLLQMSQTQPGRYSTWIEHTFCTWGMILWLDLLNRGQRCSEATPCRKKHATAI